MVKLYDKKKAVPFILRRVYLEEYQTLSREMLKPLIASCIDADFDYMFAHGIYQRDGSRGENFYNKENARFYILRTFISNQVFTQEQLIDLYKLVDDYLDFNLSYLKANGLRYPTDELYENCY